MNSKPLENTLQIMPAIPKKNKSAFKEKLKQNHLKRHKGFEHKRKDGANFNSFQKKNGC